MEPITIATALVTALSPGVAGELTLLLAKRLKAAKDEYKEKTGLEQATPLELKRRSLIFKLCSVQSDLLLTVSDHKFLERVLPLLVDQTINAYEAQTDLELTTVEMAVRQVEGVLEHYKKRMKKRAVARMLAVVVSFLALVALFILVIIGPRYGLRVETMIPILSIPFPIILWSAIGSFTAILYRFNNSGDIELQDPLRWLFTRPLTGIMIGTVTFFVIKAGLLTLTTQGPPPPIGSQELLWLVAFLVGFSDRFSDTLLRSLVGRFGGDKSADLVTMQSLSAVPDLTNFGGLLDVIPKFLRDRKTVPTVASENKPDRPNAEPTSLEATPKEVPNPVPLTAAENNDVKGQVAQSTDIRAKETIQ